MNPLTPRQREILEIIRRLISEHGYSPTLEEIGGAAGITTRYGILTHLRALRRKGYVTWEERKSRTLRILETT